MGAVAGLALPQETAGAQLAESIESESQRLARAAGVDGDVELDAGGSDSRWHQLAEPETATKGERATASHSSHRLAGEETADVQVAGGAEDEDEEDGVAGDGSAV